MSDWRPEAQEVVLAQPESPAMPCPGMATDTYAMPVWEIQLTAWKILPMHNCRKFRLNAAAVGLMNSAVVTAGCEVDPIL